MMSSSLHTPFCSKMCSVKHHDLVIALCMDDNRGKRTEFGYELGKYHVLLRECVDKFTSNGWDRNTDVPDCSKHLRFPLVYLAAAFGKHKSLEGLLKMDFSPSARSTSGETALHAAVRSLYHHIYSDSERKKAIFDNIVNVLGDHEPKIFCLSDTTRGQTPLHVAARELVEAGLCSRRTCGKQSNPDAKRIYYKGCLETMLKKILELKERLKFSEEEVISTVGQQDKEGNTILHILAASPHEYGQNVFQFITGNFQCEKLLSIKSEIGKSPLEIAVEKNQKPSALFSPLNSPVEVVIPSPTQTQANSIQVIEGNSQSSSWSPESCIVDTPHHFIKQEPAMSPVPVHVFSLADSQNNLSSPTETEYPSSVDESRERVLSDSESSVSQAEAVCKVGSHSSFHLQRSLATHQETSVSGKKALLHFLASDNVDLDPEGQSAMLGIFEQQFSRKLSDVNSKILVLEKEISGDEIAVQQKKEEILAAESHLATLKEQLRNIQSNLKDKGVKRKAMHDERMNLKRKMSMCEETKREMTRQ